MEATEQTTAATGGEELLSGFADGAGVAGGGARRRRSSGMSRGDDSTASASKEHGFECNICLDTVSEPVVTRCGHLYCWTCLYRWLHTSHTECPVCKAGVRAQTVIPVYVRGSDNVDPRTKSRSQRDPSDTTDDDYIPVPNRPAAERAQADRPRAPAQDAGHGMGSMQFGGVQFTAGFGFFPSLFGLQFQHFSAPSAGNNGEQRMTSEAAQQAFLSRVLLMLGSFVVICLLLF